MRGLVLSALLVLASCGPPSLAQTDWAGTTRACGQPANDLQRVQLVVNPEKFARVGTLLGYPRDPASGLPLEEACESLQAPVDDKLDFTQSKACETFTISYTVDMQDDVLAASADGSLVGGTISYLRDDGDTDVCELAVEREFLDS